MSDTLGLYAQEVRAYTSALSKFQLTAAARTALTNDLTKVTATQKQVRRRFGGGE